jgi:hypothetical protein
MRPFLLAVLVAVILGGCIAILVGPSYSGYAPAPAAGWPPVVAVEPAPYYCCYAYPPPYGYRYGYRR